MNLVFLDDNIGDFPPDANPLTEAQFKTLLTKGTSITLSSEFDQAVCGHITKDVLNESNKAT